MSSTTASSSSHPPYNNNITTTITTTTSQILVETKRYNCPFLQRGYCREAARCKFSHDSIGSINIPHDYCHFYLANQCHYGSDCKFRHSEPLPEELECDLCGRTCLHPYDLEQQRQHREDCLREHEREMELSFAVQRSKDKVCGICMDTVVEKKPIPSSRFGILEKCNHIFCLDCIRKWRGTKQFETRTIRACPECRVSSDFVVPSKYWIEDQDDKDKLIQDYKAALRLKPCKYFDEGKGECPFAGSCFYKHAYPDGRIAKLGAPKQRRRFDSEAVANLILWNILTSTDDDDWSNEDVESLFPELEFGTDNEDEEEEQEEEEEEEEEEDGDEDGDEDDDDDRFFIEHVCLENVQPFVRIRDVDDEDDDEDEDQDQEEEEEGFDDLVA